MNRYIIFWLFGLTTISALASEPRIEPSSQGLRNGAIFGDENLYRPQDNDGYSRGGARTHGQTANDHDKQNRSESRLSPVQPPSGVTSDETLPTVAPTPASSTITYGPLTYFVVSQPLRAVLTEIASLDAFNLNIDGAMDQTVTNTLLTGPVDTILDELGRRHSFIWNAYGNRVIDVAPLRSMVQRSIKVEELDEARIRRILASADIVDTRTSVNYDAATQVLRISGTPRFVAKAEAAIMIAAPKSADINVVRFGRTSIVVEPR